MLRAILALRPVRCAAPFTAAALACGGCSTLNPSLNPGPQIAIEGLSLRAIGPDAAEADVEVRLWVDRGDPIVLDDYQYTFRIDGRTVFTGRWAALAAAPPEDPIVRRIPVVIPLPLLPEAVRQAGAAPPAASGPSAAGAGEAPSSPREVPLRWSVNGSVGWNDPERLARILFDLGFANPRTDFAGRGEQIRMPAPDAAR